MKFALVLIPFLSFPALATETATRRTKPEDHRKITCIVGAVTSNDILDAESGGDSGHEPPYGTITFTADGEGEATLKHPLTKRTYKVFADSYTDEFVDMTYVSLAFFDATEKNRMSMGGASLRYSGKVNPRSGWDFGPAGADKLVVMNGATEVATQGHVVHSLYPVLKRHGLSGATQLMMLEPIHRAVRDAVAAGEKFDRDEAAYFFFNFMNCYRK